MQFSCNAQVSTFNYKVQVKCSHLAIEYDTRDKENVADVTADIESSKFNAYVHNEMGKCHGQVKDVNSF